MPRRTPCALFVYALTVLAPTALPASEPESAIVRVGLPGELPLPGTGLSLYHATGAFFPRSHAAPAQVALFARIAPSGGLAARTLALDLEAYLGLPLRHGLALRATLLLGNAPVVRLEGRSPDGSAWRQWRQQQPLRCRLRTAYLGLTR